MADRTDALADVVVVVRQQFGCRREGQQGDGGQRQNKDEFLDTSQHAVASLHLQHVTLLRHHFVQHRVDEESEQQPRDQPRDNNDREWFLRV